MPQFVRTSRDGYHFMLGAEVYVPIGVNYFPTGSGWAPQIWAKPHPEIWRADFPKLTALGMNTIRVFLSLSHLMPEDGAVSEAALDTLERMLDAARENGIRIIFSGPNSWEGGPDWFTAVQEKTGQNPYFTDERVLSNLELFYKTFSKRFRDHEGLFGIDLFNEPSFPFDEAMKTADHEALWAYQQQRDAGCRDFVRRMVTAIKSEDRNHLVSIGTHQYTVPFNCIHPWDYSGFDPHNTIDLLDYASFHWYSYCDPEHKIFEEDEASFQWNMGQFLCAARYMNLGKPVMFEEFGLYGGGEFHKGWWQLPYLSQHTQARWIGDVLLRGKEFVTGWLNWGFQDHPCCGDPTRFQGFFDDNGQPKELAVLFPAVRQLTEGWVRTHTPRPGPRDFPINREAILTSAEEMLRVRTEAVHRAQRGEDFLFDVK